jgi:hypothetical protein
MSPKHKWRPDTLSAGCTRTSVRKVSEQAPEGSCYPPENTALNPGGQLVRTTPDRHPDGHTLSRECPASVSVRGRKRELGW